ncbi:MAG: diphosphomevalonate decarboxylase [Acidobacteriota bacterium]|nr:diphosphomevalonate decarboxylase [Acidobacteriota bacterium]
MSQKHTVISPANIAFVKYWGARDLERAIPVQPSISMTLRNAVSHTTVEASDASGPDEVLVAAEDGTLAPAPPAFQERILPHLERLRQRAGSTAALKVATRNSFPSAAGIASSASGFSALTLATAGALGLHLEPREASVLARLSGSGSASRSVMGGYVEWPVASHGEESDEAAAAQIADAGHWQLADVIVLVETGPKDVSSLGGHRRATTSPHFARRQELLPGRLEAVRDAIRRRDLDALGPVVEEEAVELHLITMSSKPPIFYWQPATLAVMEAVRRLREEGLSAWYTMDAGANVHVICEETAAAAVASELRGVPGVRGILPDGVGAGPRVSDEDLF